MNRSRAIWVFLAVAGSLLACRALLEVVVVLFPIKPQDEIVKFVAPREKRPDPPAREPVRMFGVLVPDGETIWAFKVQGSLPSMEAFKPAFEKFLDTLKFKDKEPTWNVPKDWVEREGNQFRHATLLAPVGDDVLDLSVSKLFGRDAKSVLANVNRWRGQLNLGPIDGEELPKFVSKRKVDGRESDFADLQGVRLLRKEAPPRPEAKQPPDDVKAPQGRPKLKYDVPKGWKETKAGGNISFASFAIVDEDDIALVTLTPLPGQAGGLIANLNRWRGQVGLKEQGEADLQKGSKIIDIAGDRGVYVDYANPQHNDKKKARIVGAVFIKNEISWFLKMTGPIDLVGAQKPAFEAFAKSIRFEE